MVERGRSVSKPPAAWKLRILLAGMASVFTLTLLEVGARYYVRNLADREQFSKYASLEGYRDRIRADEWWFGLLVPHRYLGYAGAPNLVDGPNRHNSLGLRGEEIVTPKPPGEFRIACLGASTTYSIFVRDYRLSYPGLLETELRERGYDDVTVINAGIPAWSSYETLINYLLLIQDLEPDLLIIHQAFGDVAARMVWPPEAYKGDNSGYYLARLAAREPSRWAHSALLRILMVESGKGLPASAFGNSVYDEASTSYYLEFVRQRMLRTYPRGIFTEVSPLQMFEANLPLYFRRNTRNLLAAARRAGTRVLVMGFAYNPDIEGFFSIDGFSEATDGHNRILAELAEEFDVPFFDLQPVLPKEFSYWGADGIHVNEAGAALKAQLVADVLVKNRLLDR